MEEQRSRIQIEREVFLQALDKPDASDRSAFLDMACKSNPQLRRRVEELLREQAAGDRFLSEPVWTAVNKNLVAEGEAVAGLSEKLGDSIRQYRLLQKLGEGGCGVVYLAQQSEPLRREVALKVIKLGMDTKEVIARFEAERQALAVMDHPNIAKVFDAGATETGRPFFVMELVRGIRLTDHCNQNRLTISQRLQLFIQVCHAVQHAHQKGIIHRDLKPSNILVARNGDEAVPKVIDFGIARAMRRPVSKRRTKMTTAGEIIGTPTYMSPEQAASRGMDVDTRSDIYSLGVLLYELLTGHTPFDQETLEERAGMGLGSDGALSEQAPLKPSTKISKLTKQAVSELAYHRRAEASRLADSLKGDLDWIVLKALEPDRTRRYSTAAAFAQDVEHHLANQPVIARPPSKRYRFQKLVRRHQAVFASLGLLGLVLVLAVVSSTWLAIWATRAEADARLSQKMEFQMRRQAEHERERTAAQAELARLNEYVADINLAQQSLISGNYARAIQLLEKHAKHPENTDVRGFEWRYLWNQSRGDEHIGLSGRGGSVRSLSVSPNGRWLAIGRGDSLDIWGFETDHLVRSLAVREISFAFCASGDQLAIETPSDVRVVDLVSGTEKVISEEGGGAVAASHDGSLLATCTRDGVLVWNTTKWVSTGRLPGAHAPLAFSPDDKILAVGARAGITFWDPQHLERGLVLEDSQNSFHPRPWDQLGVSMIFAGNGKFLITPRNQTWQQGGWGLTLWDTQNGKQAGFLPNDPEHLEHTGPIACLAVSPDGNTVASASMDHSIRLWDVYSGRAIGVLHGHLSEVWSVSYSSDGRTLISGAKDGSVNLWTIPQDSKGDFLQGRYLPIAFSHSGRQLAVLDESRSSILFLDPITKQTHSEIELDRPRFRDPFGGDTHFSLSSDFSILAEAIGNGRVRIRDTASATTRELKVNDKGSVDVELSPDGRQLVTGGWGEPYLWWDLARQTNISLGSGWRRVVFSPGGQLLAISDKNTAELLDKAEPSRKTLLRSEFRLGGPSGFSSDGRQIAIASDALDPEQTIGIWDSGTGRLLGTLVGHKQGIHGLAFSADGRTLASSSDDGTIRLWNIATFQQLLSWPTLARGDHLVFAPDGSALVVEQWSGGQSGLRFYLAPQAEGREKPGLPRPLPSRGSRGSLLEND